MDSLHKKSSSLVILFAAGIFIAFFLPWIQFFGYGISGYNLGQLGSYGNLAWIIPILSGATLFISFSGSDNRLIGFLTGIAPILIIGFLVGDTGETVNQTGFMGRRMAETMAQMFINAIGIGGWLTIICTIGLILSPILTTAKLAATKSLESPKNDTVGDSVVNETHNYKNVPNSYKTNDGKKVDSKPYYNEANKLYKAGLYKKALSQYYKTIDKSPAFYDAHFCVAKTQVRLQSYEKGTKYFRKHINLIPKKDRATYSIGLAGILLEEGQHEKAFELVKERGDAISDEQLPTYLKILLANGKVNQVLLHLLNLPRERDPELYQQIVNDQSIKEPHRKALQKAYAIPEYHNTADKATLLANAPVENPTYSKKADALQTYVQQGQKDFGESFQRYLETLRDKITDVQHLLAECVQQNIDQKNTSRAQTQLSVLQQTDYDPAKLQSLRSSLAAVKKQNRNSYIKYAGIAALAVLVLFGAVWGYSYLSHSWAWSDAIEADNYKAYQQYIKEYPESSNVDEARAFAEQSLWEDIKKDSTQARFEEYLDRYPDGQFSSEARNILNDRYGSSSRNVVTSNTQRSAGQTNATRNARVTGSDVIIRSDHTTESDVVGVVKNKGEEVQILDEYYPQNADEAILSRSITVYENGESIKLNEGKAVSIISSGSEQVRVSFAHEEHGRVTTTIDRNYLDGISGQKWYQIRTSDGTTGWMYGQFIEEL